MPSRLTRPFASVALALTIGLAACGDPSSAPSPEQAQTADPPATDTPAAEGEIADAPSAPAAPVAPEPEPEPSLFIAAADARAVDAGLEILTAGGSAVDAAVAVQAVLGLVEPQSSGIGGGAFLVHFDAETGDVSVYDGRETAPAGATPDMFLDDLGDPFGFGRAVASGLSVGAPGVMDMLAIAHSNHGALEWSGLFADAERLGDQGFIVSERLAEVIAFAAEFHPGVTPDRTPYLFTEAGEPLPSGHRLVNADYAETMRALAENPRALLEGPLAEAIVAAATAEPDPGTLSLQDLAGYNARRVEPICRPFRELSVCGAPPPSSGGVAMAMILGMLDTIDFTEAGAEDPANWAVFLEAQRLAYADRDRFVGDDAFFPVPVTGLVDLERLAARAAAINPDAAMARAEPGDPWAFDPADPPSAPIGEDATAETPGTSHFVIVDAAGDVVSMTTTVEGPFGSARMAGGFFLNNQLTDFSFRPTDASGALSANAVAPGKRPRSSMSPTIVLSADGGFLFATGSPGGNSIIAYVAKSLVGVLAWGLSPQEAADLPNFVARGDVVRFEPDRTPQSLIDALSERGFVLEPRRLTSGLQSVLRTEDGYVGAADIRREGVVAP